MAVFEGGAIGSLQEPQVGEGVSLLAINGSTVFTDNTCEENGGAIQMSGGLDVVFGTEDVEFTGNSAQIGGGAVYLASTEVGPTFAGLTFTGNSAQTGGAAQVIASGYGTSNSGFTSPTTFDACSFTDNTAELSGGAVDSSSGDDRFDNCNFTANVAVVGGALRLAGNDVNIIGCSFDGNAAGTVNGGPAVSNVGQLDVNSLVFRRNYIQCPAGFFVDSYEMQVRTKCVGETTRPCLLVWQQSCPNPRFVARRYVREYNSECNLSSRV